MGRPLSLRPEPAPREGYSEARAYFDQALEHAPDYATTHHFLGWCLFYEGELELARASFSATPNWWKAKETITLPWD